MQKEILHPKKYDIIITGATGFVGRNLIKKIVKVYPKNKILCLTYNKNNPLEISGRKVIKSLDIKTKLVDLVTGYGLSNLPKSPELIIHLAAQADTSKEDHRVNDIGIKNLYRAFRKLNKSTHFIHIGTMVVAAGRSNCNDPISEETADYPSNKYTRTKLAGEKFIIQKCLKDKFKLTVIRPNTIYGIGVRRNSLFDMVREMVKKESFITKINWPGRSALIHVNDVTDLIVRFAKLSPLPGKPEKYLAYSENLSISQISKIIKKKIKINDSSIIIPDFLWTLIKKTRNLIPLFENIIPGSLYNYLWRFGLIVDDVVYCKSMKLFKKLPDFKPIKFSDAVDDIIKDFQ